MVWLKDAFPVCMYWFWISGGYVWLDAAGRYRYRAFSIVPGLSVMLTGSAGGYKGRAGVCQFSFGGIFLSLISPLICPVGGSNFRMESSTTKNTPYVNQ